MADNKMGDKLSFMYQVIILSITILFFCGAKISHLDIRRKYYQKDLSLCL